MFKVHSPNQSLHCLLPDALSLPRSAFRLFTNDLRLLTSFSNMHCEIVAKHAVLGAGDPELTMQTLEHTVWPGRQTRSVGVRAAHPQALAGRGWREGADVPQYQAKDAGQPASLCIPAPCSLGGRLGKWSSFWAVNKIQ